MLPRLPLKISTFRKLRESNYVYVDKTRYAYDLLMNEPRCFLSRPRRFGKSLFVSTLKEILAGEKDLFDGLWIANSDYQWQKHGVIVFDFSMLDIGSVEDFKKSLCHWLLVIANDYDLDIMVDQNIPSIAIKQVASALYKKFRRVAILVDEYDNPILNTLNDTEKAVAIRDTIKHFFGVIKGLDEYVDFVFITGVSSFAKAGLFSGMNNLQILTLEDNFSGICGYTDAEVDHYFSGYVQAWADAHSPEPLTYDDLRSQIKNWYNGYCFGREVPTVYNPFSLMHALAKKEFKSFWIQSGTPTFLIEELKKKYFTHENIMVDPEDFEVNENILQAFDVGAIPIPALMFQAGYLTLAGYDKTHKLYSLAYPNYEVEIAFKEYLVEIFTHLDTLTVSRIYTRLRTSLNDGDVVETVSLIRQLFSRVTYYEHEGTESYYHTTLQNAFTLGGIEAQSQYATSHGRIDMILTLPKMLYIIEIKFNQPAEIALQQIEDRRYYEPFLQQGKPIVLLGLSFTRNPKNFDIAYATKTIDGAKK